MHNFKFCFSQEIVILHVLIKVHNCTVYQTDSKESQHKINLIELYTGF